MQLPEDNKIRPAEAVCGIQAGRINDLLLQVFHPFLDDPVPAFSHIPPKEDLCP